MCIWTEASPQPCKSESLCVQTPHTPEEEGKRSSWGASEWITVLGGAEAIAPPAARGRDHPGCPPGARRALHSPGKSERVKVSVYLHVLVGSHGGHGLEHSKQEQSVRQGSGLQCEDAISGVAFVCTQHGREQVLAGSVYTTMPCASAA